MFDSFSFRSVGQLKNILSLLLAVTLLFSAAVPGFLAYAEEAVTEEAEGVTESSDPDLDAPSESVGPKSSEAAAALPASDESSAAAEPEALPAEAVFESEEEPDTDPPVVKALSAAVVRGANVTPSTFVQHYEDAGIVTLRFTEKPDTGLLGKYPVTIVAEDDSGNVTTAHVTLYVCDSVIDLELEDRTYTGLQLREKVGELHGYHPSIETYKVSSEGASTFQLKKGDTVMVVGIQVRDTTRPKAKAVEQICYLGYPRTAGEFVKDISDQQAVAVDFLTEPDWDVPGEREVKITLIDASYNRRIVTVNTVFKQDDIPPVLSINLPPYHYVGDAVAYMKAASAQDNLDPNCEISVDKSQVKYREVGTYPVTYTATDRDGNSSNVTVQISFREPGVTDEQLDELAESVLSEILDDSMSVAEQIKAIYNYCRYKIRYTGDSDKSDWKGEAYRGLTEFKGDCFTYYSAAFLLLNKIDGVEVLSVERLGGLTHHYWCLVNVGTGWYHFDTCPNHIYGTCFMRTNEQIQNGEGKVYWNFDRSLLPDVATTAFKMF